MQRCVAVGMQALILSVILSLCVEGSVSQGRARLSVWTDHTSAADATVAAGIGSSGLTSLGQNAEGPWTEAVSTSFHETGGEQVRMSGIFGLSGNTSRPFHNTSN